MSTISKLTAPSLTPKPSDLLTQFMPDQGAKKAMADLLKANPGAQSISGQEMADAIIAGTRDPDNQAAGKEFAVIQAFVQKNGGKLSPEAKKVFETYQAAVNVAKANGHTGIDARSYAKLERDLQQAGKPRYADKSAGEQLKDLAAENKTPGSISGQEMTNAILKGTKDTDAQAAGREFRDVEKFVRENAQLLSPEARAAYAVYERAARAAQAQGQTGIDDASYQRMARDMARASAGPAQPKATPKQPVIPDKWRPVSAQVDAGAAKALEQLGAANPGPGSISGNEMAAAIKAATEDLDGQAAGAEYRQIADFVRKNEGKLSPEAKAAFAVYQREAKAAIAKGQTGIETPVFEKMVKEMEAAGTPKYQDAGMGAELNALAAANTTPGSITARQLAEAVSKGARDLDGSSAGKEFEDLAKFVAENQQLLTPDAKAAFALYEKAAMDARAKGSTSVGSLEQFDALVKQMASTASGALPKALPKTFPKEPVFPGPQASVDDLERFAADLQAYQATLPPSPAALSGIPVPKIPGPNASAADWQQHAADVQKYTEALKAAGFTPLPGLVQPAMPGPNATALDLARYARDFQKFMGAFAAPKAGSASTATATPSTSSPAPAPVPTQTSTPAQVAFAGGIEDRALQGLQGLNEPKEPSPNATEADLAKYQRDLGKYNRMFEMYSKIMANAHEMKKSLIANFPR